MTALLFRTAAGGVTLAAGEAKDLGLVDVGAHRRVRVVGVGRAGSVVEVTVRLLLVEGQELVGDLQRFVLKPESTHSELLELPGLKLMLRAEAAAGTGTAAVDVLLYGG